MHKCPKNVDTLSEPGKGRQGERITGKCLQTKWTRVIGRWRTGDKGRMSRWITDLQLDWKPALTWFKAPACLIEYVPRGGSNGLSDLWWRWQETGRRLMECKMKWPQFVTDRTERPALHPQNPIFGQRKITLTRMKKTKNSACVLALWNPETRQLISPRNMKKDFRNHKTTSWWRSFLPWRSSEPPPWWPDGSTRHWSLCAAWSSSCPLWETQEMVLVFKKTNKKTPKFPWVFRRTEEGVIPEK